MVRIVCDGIRNAGVRSNLTGMWRDCHTLSAPAVAELAHRLTVGRGQQVEVALNGLGDDTPLRFGADETERLELHLYVRRHANAQLRVVPDHLAMRAGGGTTGRAAFGRSCRHG